MAFFDTSLLLSNAQAVTSTAASTNIYDVTGAGSGTAPAMIWGTSTVIGDDIGTGEGVARPVAYFTVPTAFTAGGAATLVVSVQAAVDNGSNAPGTYFTLTETQAIPVASLVAGYNFALPIPGIKSGDSLPRFYRFNYTVATGPMLTGNITGDILLNPPSQINIKYPSNFTSV